MGDEKKQVEQTPWGFMGLNLNYCSRTTTKFPLVIGNPPANSSYTQGLIGFVDSRSKGEGNATKIIRQYPNPEIEQMQQEEEKRKKEGKWTVKELLEQDPNILDPMDTTRAEEFKIFRNEYVCYGKTNQPFIRVLVFDDFGAGSDRVLYNIISNDVNLFVQMYNFVLENGYEKITEFVPSAEYNELKIRTNIVKEHIPLDIFG